MRIDCVDPQFDARLEEARAVEQAEGGQGGEETHKKVIGLGSRPQGETRQSYFTRSGGQETESGEWKAQQGASGSPEKVDSGHRGSESVEEDAGRLFSGWA